ARAQLIERYVANAPQCPAMWIAPAMWTEPTHPPGCWTRRWGGGAAIRLARMDRWAATGRFEGAAAEKAVPFPGAVRRCSLRRAQPIFRGPVAHEVGGLGLIRLKRGA